MELKPDIKPVEGVQPEEQIPVTMPIISSPTTESEAESVIVEQPASSLVDSSIDSLKFDQNHDNQSNVISENSDHLNNSSPQLVSSGSSMSTSSLPLSQTQTPSNAQRPGERLRQARLLKGRDLKDIATELNINERILIAIEADDYKSLPEPAFIRGYLRGYGRLLGVDSDVLIMQFNEIYTSSTGLSSNHSLENSPLQQLAKLQSRTRKSKRWMLWLLIPVVIIVLIFALVLPLIKHIMSAKNDSGAAHTVILNDNTQNSTTVTTQLPQTNTAPISALPPVATTQSASDQLVLTLSKPSDVVVQDSTGKTLISGTQGTAQPLTLNGVSPFSITLADAANVTLSLNGEHVDLSPYTVDGHASFRLSR